MEWVQNSHPVQAGPRHGEKAIRQMERVGHSHPAQAHPRRGERSNEANGKGGEPTYCAGIGRIG